MSASESNTTLSFPGELVDPWQTREAKLTVPVLQLLSKERGVYGLRNGDYERYRSVLI